MEKTELKIKEVGPKDVDGYVRYKQNAHVYAGIVESATLR